MDRDTAVTRIQDGLGFRTDHADKIVLRLQEEQRELERGKTLPSFLLREDETLALLTGENSVALPSDYLRRSDRALRYYPDSGEVFRTIPWRDYAAASAAYVDYEASGPAVATLRTLSIEFFPTADNDYDITWSYYRKGDLLTSNVENLWLANAPELLIGGAGMRMAKDIRNERGEKLFTEMYRQARTTWFAETIVEEQEDVLVLGGNS